MTGMEVGIWVIGGLLTIIGILIGVIFRAAVKKIDEMMRFQAMFVEEIVDLKKDSVKSLSWLKSHEQRIGLIEKDIRKK